jgi:serine/threonine-protein kinase
MTESQTTSPASAGPSGEELIELEPTMTMQLLGGTESRGAGVGLVEGSFASLAGEINTLRRRRLGAVALFLTVATTLSFFWFVFTANDMPAIVLFLIGLRFVIAASVAGMLVSRMSLAPSHVKGLEYLLFGAFTLISVISQYQGNLDLLRNGDAIGFMAHVKDGVIGMFALMVLYAMFIPNDIMSTARVVLTMALAPVLAVVLLLELEHPELTEVTERLRSVESGGTNVLFLLLGAGLSIYGSYVLSGLRSQLHEARKFGQYQLRRKLGAGGMGEVYLAEHQLLKRPCALKLIKPEAGADPIALARFEREVQSAARLSHPNTIAIYDYGHTDDGTFYYVMEYLPGISLQDLVQAHGALPPGRVVYLFRQICAALAEAHAQGLVHRDLKPANIFIAARGGETDVAKVLDFGLVKLLRGEGNLELSSDQTVSGTPLYMAPEQATATRSLDARADIYALGAMMYFALTGQPPFTGESALEVLMAHARDPVTPPSRLRPEVPADLEQVVLRCLSKKAEDRYADVKSLGKALAACASADGWDGEQADTWWGEANRLDTASPHA